MVFVPPIFNRLEHKWKVQSAVNVNLMGIIFLSSVCDLRQTSYKYAVDFKVCLGTIYICIKKINFIEVDHQDKA